jgi:hypothetical protein
MDEGTRVYRAYVFTDGVNYLIDEGVVSAIAVNGEPLVRLGGALLPMASPFPGVCGWRLTKAAAQADAADALARTIGRWQAKLDDLRGEILHATLTTEDAA